MPRKPSCRTSGIARVSHRLAAVLLLLGALSCVAREKPKLFVLGLDGATWDLLDPWIEAGDLPNLKALRDQSAWGTMNSVVPYLSPPAWTSAITGVNPGRHGIFDFQHRLSQQATIVTETANSRHSPPIWMMLKGRGLKCGVVNVPMTSPPDQLDGFMVSGFPHLPTIDWAEPRALEERLKGMGYLLDEMEMKLPAGEEDRIYARYLASLQKRAEIVKTLYAEDEYDLFWVVYTETDRVQHCFWQFDDPASPKYTAERAARWGGSIKKLWIEQDRIIGEMLGMLAPNTWVLVVSDHGFGPMHRELRIQNFLRAPGSTVSADEADELFSLDRSDAARLYLREPGKDPGGHLSPNERKELEQRVVAALAGATDPKTSEKPVDVAYSRDQVFVGRYAEKGPTLTLQPSGAWAFTVGDMDTDYQAAPFDDCTSSLSGWHRMNGIFALRGPGVRPGHLARTYSLLDVVPTCLYVLEQAMAEDLDGDLMADCFTDRYRSRVKKVERGRLSEEDRELTPEELEQIQNIPYMGK